MYNFILFFNIYIFIYTYLYIFPIKGIKIVLQLKRKTAYRKRPL